MTAKAKIQSKMCQKRDARNRKTVTEIKREREMEREREREREREERERERWREQCAHPLCSPLYPG